MMKILLIEDETLLAQALKNLFEQHAIQTDIEYDGVKGLRRALTKMYDLIVLDLMLPGLDGMSVLAEIRKKGQNTPVLLLTAKDSLEDKVAGLNAGADDYLVKPFETDELLARIHALARRSRSMQEPSKLSGLTLNPQTMEMAAGDKQQSLTQKEYALLEALLSRQNEPISKEAIMSIVWGDESTISENSVELYIHYLRKKLEDTGYAIKTKRNRGYMLVKTES